MDGRTESWMDGEKRNFIKNNKIWEVGESQD